MIFGACRDLRRITAIEILKPHKPILISVQSLIVCTLALNYTEPSMILIQMNITRGHSGTFKRVDGCMRLLSDAAEYGLRAVVWLAAHPERSWTVHDIAENTKSKPGYLVKVLQALARAGIVTAQRGVGGGVQLSVPPKQLCALDVINAVDPLARITHCPLGLENHGKRLCPLHRQIDDAVRQIEQHFAKVTVSEVLRDKRASMPLCGA